MYQHKLSKVVHLEGEPVGSQHPTNTSLFQRPCFSKLASARDARRPSERARKFLSKMGKSPILFTSQMLGTECLHAVQ